MTRRMTEQESQEFLAEPHVGVLSVASDSDRPPLTVQVWYGYEPGGNVTFFTGTRGRKARKTRLIEKAGVLSLSVQREEFPYKHVTIESIVVGSAPPERAGAAASISETGSELGGALGIAVLGSIGTAVYRGLMGDVVSGGAPPEAAQAARDTLGGAVAVSDQLPGPLGAELLDAAREAFVQGLQITAGISAVIAAVLAILAAVLLRHVRMGSEPERPADPELDAAIPGSPDVGRVLSPAATMPKNCVSRIEP